MAFLLQGNRTEPVWGQTLTGESPQALPVLGGATVYQTTTCTGGYSNNENQPLDHNYVNGVCCRCGEHEPPNKAVDGFYEIYDQWQLRWFADQVNNKGKTNINAKLMDDIKLNGDNKVLDDNGNLIAGTSTLKAWTPIGTFGQPFTGTFDGNGKTIYGLYYNNSETSEVGLFGGVGKGGKVINVTLADSYVSGNKYVGGICGQNMGGTLQNCHNTGTVSGDTNVGGVCGYSEGTLQESYNTGDITGNDSVGGVCGDNRSTVNGCYTTGDVTGNAYVGGVCGYIYGGTVNGCYTTGKVTGKVTGKANVGSLCGYIFGSSTMEKCYYLAGTSEKAVGGEFSVSINCVSKTKLQFQNGEVAFLLQKDLGINTQVWGQRIGTDKTPVLNSETDYKVYHPTSGTSPCTGGYSNKSDGTLNHQYENSVCIYCGEPASEEIVDGYYQIATADQLRQFAKKVNSGNYNINARLTADIKLNGDNKVLNDDGSLISDPGNLKSWTPIGTFNDKFKGTFDGNGKTIYGLYYNNSGEDDVGLFCGVGEGGKVINVTLADSYVSGDNTVGGICGWNDGGTLQGCHNTGTVSGTYFVGGVCGINRSGTIQKCDNAGTVSGTNDKVGGVCGSNTGNMNSPPSTIQECYNTGTVSGKSWVGGVCGENNRATLEKSYNIGTVSGRGNYIGGVCGDNYNSGTVKGCYSKFSGRGVCGDNSATVENCYYLSTKSGTAHRNGGISKTEAEFKSGEVAYQMQNDLGQNAEPVRGQTIGTNASPVLAWQLQQVALCQTRKV